MKIVEYDVVRGEGLKWLASEMNSFIEDGWQPIGGISQCEIDYGGGCSANEFCQAMVRYE